MIHSPTCTAGKESTCTVRKEWVRGQGWALLPSPEKPAVDDKPMLHSYQRKLKEAFPSCISSGTNKNEKYSLFKMELTVAVQETEAEVLDWWIL